MKKYLLALIVITSTLTGTAQAQHCCEDHFYVGALGGVNFLSDIDTLVGKISFDTGYLIGGNLGYRPSPYYHFETEIAFRQNDKTKHFYELGQTFKAKARIETLSFMVNAYTDFANCFQGYATPYVGVGIGYAINHASVRETGQYYSYRMSALSHNFAYQGIVGINTEICHKTKVGLEYRFFKPENDLNEHAIALTISRAI